MGDSVSLTKRIKTRGSATFSRHDLLPFGALVRVELLRTLRLKRTILFLALFLVVASVVALLNWPTYESTRSGTGSDARMISVFCLLIGNCWLVRFLIYPLLAARGKSITRLRPVLFVDLFVTKPRKRPTFTSIPYLDLDENDSVSLSRYFYHGLLGPVPQRDNS